MLRTVVALAAIAITTTSCAARKPELKALQDDGKWFVLSKEQLALGPHHTRHAEVFGPAVTGTYNEQILAGIDKVQATAMDGGGYFIGIKAVPTESPIGYDLPLFGQPLLSAPRTTSYCSGASYSAFIEGMNLIYPDGGKRISPERFESLRMQEPDGGRREDTVKYWGKWNDDGFGSQYALVQYSGMGREITPIEARPGDFMNISWVSGLGHSVVFLGWKVDPDTGERGVLYWASQKGTNGLGDQFSPLEKIKVVKTVRLTNPENVFSFDVDKTVERRIPGDKIEL
ncbi:hypothetical protein GC173_01340 [bacterium]|nr:hypothetical protein [bacterium]